MEGGEQRQFILCDIGRIGKADEQTDHLNIHIKSSKVTINSASKLKFEELIHTIIPTDLTSTIVAPYLFSGRSSCIAVNLTT